MALSTVYYSWVIYPGPQSAGASLSLTTASGLAIDYLERRHITVKIVPNPSDLVPSYIALTRPAQWDFNAAGTSIVIVDAVPAGSVILIKRNTPADAPYELFTEGSLLTAEQLNLSERWALYTSQESIEASLASVDVATTALGTASFASTNASSALSAASGSASNASTALSTANTAAGNASTALSTANTAAGNASTALSTANTASTNASTAVSTASSANIKADQALNAISSSIAYTLVANVSAIPGTPSNNQYVEVSDSTLVQYFTPLSGKPAGFIGDSGISVRIVYSSALTTWQWISYSTKDPEARYLKSTNASSTYQTLAGMLPYASLAAPAFTGVPTAPTATTGTNTTQLATTAFVQTGLLPYASLAAPAFTGVPTAPTAATGTNTTQLATTAFVQTDLALRLALAGGTLSGRLNLLSYSETIVTATISSGVLGINLALGSAFNVSLSSSVSSFSFSNVQASRSNAITLFFTGDGTTRTINWGSIRWAWATAPLFTFANGKVNIVSLVTNDGGTTWFAFDCGGNF